MRAVTGLRAEGNHRLVVLADGAEISARAVVLATRASYQRLGVPRVEGLVGSGVFYGGGVTEAPAMTGQRKLALARRPGRDGRSRLPKRSGKGQQRS